MARLIPTDFLNDAKKNQQQHVEDMSRDIIIITGEDLSEDCPNCYYDTVAGTSAASYTGFTGTITIFSGTAYEQTFEARNFRQICPVCGGAGVFTVPLTKTVPAHVRWGTLGTRQSEILIVSPPGIEGQHKVKLKSHSDYYEDYLKAKYFIVDGIDVEADTAPIVRGIGQKEGVVEIWCKTMESGDKRVRT